MMLGVNRCVSSVSNLFDDGMFYGVRILLFWLCCALGYYLLWLCCAVFVQFYGGRLFNIVFGEGLEGHR